MKILLEAYLARNFGDDLFVMLLARHYHEHEFYLIDDENRGAAIIHSNHLHNLHSIAKQEVAQCIHEFGAYIFVGGDFYPPYIDYDGRCDRIGRIKENRGRVFVLGASLYKHYPEDSLPDVNRFFNMVDVVSFRDKASYEQCKHLFPRVCAYDTCDMAFTLSDQFPPKSFDITHIENLGISVRRKINGTQTEYATYIGEMAETAETHLKRSRENRVTFLAFSTCEFDDRDTADDIIALIDEPVRDRIRIVEYSRDVMAFIEQIGVCDAMICTRFHSLCMALILSKPFAVINYEAKIENLLSDLKYEGLMVSYGESITGEELLDSIKSNRVDAEALGIYRSEGNYFFCLSDLMLEMDTDIMKTKSNDANVNVEKEIIKRQQKLLNEQKEKINQQLKALSVQKEENEFLKNRIENCEEKLADAQCFCNELAKNKSFKVAHLMSRVKHQMLNEKEEERKDFWRWVAGRVAGRPDLNHQYNQVFSIIERLQGIRNSLLLNAPNEGVFITVDPATIEENANERSVRQFRSNKYIHEKYDKPDVIMLSVIDYDFRFQRPQHFAKHFAKNGYRVFYINANFSNLEQTVQREENLYIVDFKTTKCNAIYFNNQWSEFESWILEKLENLINIYAIRDAVLVLDYPNWINVSCNLRKKYGFKMVADYMDDATGFLGTTTDVLKDNCERMLRECDLIVPSSQFLSEIACKYNDNLIIIRNGTEVEHFHKAIEIKKAHGRPIIGYYGAVSHWFDWEKVCYLAEHLPQCDVVIVGEITEYRDKLEQYSNIRLLGEKKYQSLPKYLADFDVCLIPFDTETDLIRATNPVKFYEYLSAGKRVVATEIPELEPYRDRYVYMSNDNEQFLKYVQMCLDGRDTLAEPSECVSFAKENDWQNRYEAFHQACVEVFPRVSIIVLTYNNLKLNKYCINSILEKTAYPNYELIVVDNQSKDGTIDYLKELDARNDPHIKVVLNDENLGFAKGNNRAILNTTCKYVVLLNNDTVVTRGWLSSLVKHMEENPKCGMVGAVTNSIGNEQMIRVQYRNMTELDAFAYDYTYKHMGETWNDVDRIPLFCTIIRKDMMDKYGVLDDEYRVGMFEDDDYAMVVKKAGYNFFAAEDCFVHHVNNASFKKLQSEEYQKIFDENRKRFEKKWNTTWRVPKYRKGVTGVINEGCMVEPVE